GGEAGGSLAEGLEKRVRRRHREQHLTCGVRTCTRGRRPARDSRRRGGRARRRTAAFTIVNRAFVRCVRSPPLLEHRADLTARSSQGGFCDTRAVIRPT